MGFFDDEFLNWVVSIFGLGKILFIVGVEFVFVVVEENGGFGESSNLEMID